MKIILGAPKEIVEQVEVKKVIEFVEIISIFDDYKSVTVTISFNEAVNLNFKTLILWDNEAYEAIGQYTDDDIKKRILELI